MKKTGLLSGFLLFVCATVLTGQVPDSILTPTIRDNPLLQADTIHTPSPAVDTVSVKKRGFIGRIFKEDYPNPKKALFLSLAVPGAGQIYNKRWWKVPIVYGAYAGLILAIDFNTTNYRRFRDAYIAELNNQPHEFSDTRLDANDLRRIRDGYDKNKQLSYIGLVAVHLVQTAEAFVDCHLKTFDVSEDLSMRVSPSVGMLPTGSAWMGIGIAVRIGK